MHLCAVNVLARYALGSAWRVAARSGRWKMRAELVKEDAHTRYTDNCLLAGVTIAFVVMCVIVVVVLFMHALCFVNVCVVVVQFYQ